MSRRLRPKHMRSPSLRLLIVDDEAAIRRVLGTSLRAIGYDIDEAAGGEEALGLLQRHRADLILLDINMPGMGGIETCRRIREIAPRAGIIMISVRSQEDDMVQALEAGADDYVTKPFRLRELLARLRSVRRRTQAGEPEPVLRAGELELDVANRLFRKAGCEIRLSQKEFDILTYRMQHADVPVPHAKLLQAVWGPEYGGETEYLRTYMKQLRRKIERDASQPEYLVTEPWLGYRFRNPEQHREDVLAPVA
jgi:two-component system KDP operon response regulator KdpE